jgi:hypothetical protein
MSTADLQAVKVTHRELWEQYGRLLEHVHQPRSSRILKMLVEGHISDRLTELSKAYTIIAMSSRGVEDEVSDWAREAAAECDGVVSKLTPLKEAASKRFNLVLKILTLITGLILLLYFGTTDIFLVLKNNSAIISKYLSTIIQIGSIGLTVLVAGIMILVTQYYNKKRGLFGSTQISSTRLKTPGFDTDIYSLEYLLFSMLGREYPPELPLDYVAFGIYALSPFLVAFGLMIPIFSELKPSLADIAVAVGGLILAIAIWYLSFIRPRMKPIPPM